VAEKKMNKLDDKQGEDQKEPRDEKAKKKPFSSGSANSAVKEKEPRCDPKQLALLKECSEQKDITDWNKWREENPKEDIWLEYAGLSHYHLEGANLNNAHLEGAILIGAYLEGANLSLAHLKQANVSHAHLERAWCSHAHLEGALLNHAHLEGAWFGCAHLEGTQLVDAHLEGTNLPGAYLEGADLYRAHLKGVHLRDSHLEGADLWGAHIEGSIFQASVVDGLTLFWNCSLDRKTDFRGVGLDTCRIDEGTKYLLQYNKRRMNWKDWYKGKSGNKWVRKMHQLLTCPVRLFWCMSDYGRSTIRILAVFLVLSIVFAVAYWAKPDCVMVNGQVGGLRNFLHASYFSVVTMTTLGFGDIAANPQSGCGQVLLMLQVFCGYFLLGAIVTRLSILFTAGGPAGRFSKRKK